MGKLDEIIRSSLTLINKNFNLTSILTPNSELLSLTQDLRPYHLSPIRSAGVLLQFNMNCVITFVLTIAGLHYREAKSTVF